jgi:hypothetical protein
MFSSEQCDLRHANAYKMMERLGIEWGDGVIPRFGLAFSAAVRNCKTCKSVPACTAWLADAASTSVAPVFCRSADIFFELVVDGQTVQSTTDRQ